MPAVFHAQYSYTYVSALDIEIIMAGEDPITIATKSLALNLPKLQFGLEVIRQHVRLDDDGADFMEGFFAWSSKVIEDGHKILNEFCIPAKTFTHPLGLHGADDPNESQMSAKLPLK